MYRYLRPALLSLLLLGGPALAADPGKVKVNSAKVNDWNTFAENLARLNKSILDNHPARQEERSGGYPDMPDFYREVVSYARDSGSLLSRVQYARHNPELIHLIEVYVYDEQKRLTRDYLAAYLPGGRNAPVQTLITLHGYTEDVHGFRSFDASGELVGEQCRRNNADEQILLMLDFDEIYAARRNQGKVLQSALYKKCFNNIPERLEEAHYPRSLLSTRQ